MTKNNKSRKNNLKGDDGMLTASKSSNSAFVVQKGKAQDFLKFVNEKSPSSQAAMEKARAFAKKNKK